jgi:hypothetical protein
MASSSDWQDAPLEMRLDYGASGLEKTGVYGKPNLEDTWQSPGDPGDTGVYRKEDGEIIRNRKLHALLVQLNGPRAYDISKIDRHHMTLGRVMVSEGCIVIDDPAVSNPHCKFHTERDEAGAVQSMLVEDLESENGTWVNGKMVNKAVLQDRDVITVGETELLFVRI